MTVSLNGYTAGYATLEAAEGLEPGVVAMSGDHQVDAPAAGAAFAGVALSVPGRSGAGAAFRHLPAALHRYRAHSGLL